MRYKSARLAWHDAFYQRGSTALYDSLQLGTSVQKSNKNNSTDIAIRQWLAGKIQHAITTLNPALQCFGSYLYKPEFSIDELETAHEAVWLILKNNHSNQWTAVKAERLYWLVRAALKDYRSWVNRQTWFFSSPAKLCKWLHDEHGIKLDRSNWHRDYLAIYDEIKAICDALDKQTLAPVAQVIQAFNKVKEQVA